MGLVSYGPAVELLRFGWVLYFLGFLVSHIRVRIRRAREGSHSQRIGIARASDAGFVLEAIGIALVMVLRRPQPSGVPVAVFTASLLVAAASILFAWVALHHLGRQWRIRAVVTDDHTLVITGPYAIVRHPIYTSLAGMLVATAIMVSHWWAFLAGALICILGTEIRVRAEDRILGSRFPSDFPEYRRRVPAYIPLAGR
jgi:protein-S-isoprenylcysteine O-methyltransferase Ste14